MSETETTDAFLKRMEYTIYLSVSERLRLLSLARRGAAIPDEPTEAMAIAGTKQFRPQAVEYVVSEGLRRQNCINAAPCFIWKAMLSTALNESSNAE
jgi:hypothetical protein